jgi:hypothetical protein
VNGAEKFQGKVERNVQAIWESLLERLDGKSVASGVLSFKL